MARFGNERFFDLLNRHGAASCGFASRPGPTYRSVPAHTAGPPKYSPSSFDRYAHTITDGSGLDALLAAPEV